MYTYTAERSYFCLITELPRRLLVTVRGERPGNEIGHVYLLRDWGARRWWSSKGFNRVKREAAPKMFPPFFLDQQMVHVFTLRMKKHTSDVSEAFFFFSLHPIPKQFYDQGPPFKLKRFMDFCFVFFLLFQTCDIFGHFPIIEFWQSLGNWSFSCGLQSKLTHFARTHSHDGAGMHQTRASKPWIVHVYVTSTTYT